MDSRECVLVTGASRGIGRAILERLIADGMHVINFDKESPVKIAEHEKIHSFLFLYSIPAFLR